MRKIIYLSIICILTLPSRSNADRVVSIKDLGIKPDTREDVTAAFRSALDECREKGIRVLELEPGRYDFWPDDAVKREIFVSNTSDEEECPSKVKTIGLLMEDMNDFTIDGHGAELIFHGKQTMVSTIHSQNITLENLSIDCERPGGSEIVIEQVGDGMVTVRFKPDSWYAIDGDGHIELVGEGWRTEHPHCIEFDPDTEHLTYSGLWDILRVSRATEVDPGLVRFEVPSSNAFTVGHTLTVRDRYRDEVGILNLESEGITFRNMNIHYLHAIGVISQFCRDVTYENLHCEPRKGSGRILASSADFLHFSGCAGKVTVLNSRFSGAQDDPINVHGTYLSVVEKASPTQLRLRFMHHQTYGMQAFWKGDTVTFVNAASLQPKASGTVAGVERLTDRDVLLTMEEEIPDSIIPGEDVVENLTWTPEVEIRGCRFTRTNTRGTLVTTPRKVVIADNVYLKTGMHAILISGDASNWYESGAVKDVTIEGNRFIDCAYNSCKENAVISIDPSNTVIDSLHPVHSNIVIRGNRFETWGNDILYSKSVGGLVMENNKITPIEVTQDEMKEVYEQVKTPVKIGQVIFPGDTTLLSDSPGVFRHDGKWYMSWIAFDGRGYETWLSESDDLIHWTNLGKTLSYRPGTWDCWQRAGYPALQDIGWGGSYELEKYDGKYWMSYLAGEESGYEAGTLAVGIGCSDNVGRAEEWMTFDSPVLSPKDTASQWFEKNTQYKSNIIHDTEGVSGHRFVMYYNAKGTDPDSGVTAERIGIAFSEDMLHWSRYEGNPVLKHETSGITGDPQIQKIGDLYVMFYFRAFEPSRPYRAFNSFACSRDLIHWYDWEGEDLIYPTEDYDCLYAHKSWVIRWEGVTYHFYCACDDSGHRCIALATSAVKN